MALDFSGRRASMRWFSSTDQLVALTLLSAAKQWFQQLPHTKEDAV